MENLIRIEISEDQYPTINYLRRKLSEKIEFYNMILSTTLDDLEITKFSEIKDIIKNYSIDGLIEESENLLEQE
jgi:hypothetical protein